MIDDSIMIVIKVGIASYYCYLQLFLFIPLLSPMPGPAVELGILPYGYARGGTSGL